MKKLIFLLVFCLLGISSVWAQKTFSGKVIGPDGLGLPGVNVVEKANPMNGAATDLDGNWTLVLPSDNSILQFTAIGMKPIEVKASDAAVVNMIADSQMLDEVVVTAMGMTRDKKSVGFAVQDVGADELNKVKQTDAISALSGKAAGVQISKGSGMSGSNRILIRGANSIFGENQPLFVVDGVPMDNANYNSSSAQQGFGGIDYGNMLNDLNPDDIENISILKGAAAALYGSRASNGVVMVTTKKAKAGRDVVKVSVSTGVEFESIHDLPDLQRKYGGGSIVPDSKGGVNGFEQATINGTTYNVPQYATDESWGPKYDPNLTYLPWYAFDEESFPNDYLKPVPWVAPEHDVEDFFETGVKFTNSVSLAKSGDAYGIRFGYTNTNLEGFVPNSEQNKNNFSLNGNAKILEKLKVEAGINFSRQKTSGRPTFGYDGNSFAQKFFQWGQRQLDYEKLKDYKRIDGSQRTWNRKAWNNSTPNYADNPYWTVNENYSDDERDRFWGNLSLTYELLEGLTARGSVYADTYTFYNRERIALGSQAQSWFYEAVRNNYEYNYELTLNYVKDITDDFNISALLGGNTRHSRFTLNRGETSGGLIVPGIWNLKNSTGNVAINDFESKKKVNSLFASASLGFKNMLFLDLTARNDWSSTLPDDNNSYFYPSASLGFIFSELTKTEMPWLSFGKLRLGWSEVGSDTDPYRVVTTYEYNPEGPFKASPRLRAKSELLNEDLKPETTTTKEIGLDLRMFDNRLGLSATLYQINTTDQIIPLTLSKTTGYESKWINAGEMENKGVELTLTGTPIRTDNFNWDISINYSKNESELVELYPGIHELQIGRAAFSRAYLKATAGEAYGQLVGYNHIYDSEGNKVIGANGQYLKTKDIEPLGSVIPDYNLGIRNSFTYKNFDFSFLFDIQKGGKFFSVSHMWGMYSGMMGATAGVNDKGNEIRADVADGGGIKLEGVTGDVTWNEDGSYTVSNTKPNEKYIDGQTWAQTYYTSGLGTLSMFDADYVKLREVNIGYTFSNVKFGPFNSLRVSAYGKNLIVTGLDLKGFDPETTVGGSGNIQGLEGGFVPATRSYGFNIQFGF
ncbi:TonB-linked SusC/RagA family outer membrane protein [Balneicella halophila]|uniref:TonB-linked SusC/RagA family outer membrane protein n=1 Tax=Balneicella halophila TaxID=1537566 RepID=A0A7L4US02_BALHA|nr:SusC/RagA family TonB-linked outer membrane protein [Balneicella halophila]PVX52556.1 TonB-linked SusC/RagA family outer membrane protein [Balneicella halophila]